MSNHIATAIVKKWPGAQVSVNEPKAGPIEIIWHDHSSVSEKTQVEIDAAVVEYEAYLTSIAYRADRVNSYPNLGDFADAVYWAQKGDDNKMSAWVALCDKVKSDNPKP